MTGRPAAGRPKRPASARFSAEPERTACRSDAQVDPRKHGRSRGMPRAGRCGAPCFETSACLTVSRRKTRSRAPPRLSSPAVARGPLCRPPVRPALPRDGGLLRPAEGSALAVPAEPFARCGAVSALARSARLGPQAAPSGRLRRTSRGECPHRPNGTRARGCRRRRSLGPRSVMGFHHDAASFGVPVAPFESLKGMSAADATSWRRRPCGMRGSSGGAGSGQASDDDIGRMTRNDGCWRGGSRILP
jgi:hypothetical protein